MNLEKLFDFLCLNHNAKGDNFKFDGKIITPKMASHVIQKSIQAFIHQPKIVDPYNKELKIQAFEGSSSLPKLTKDVFNVTMAVENYDILWQNAFKGIPLKKGQLEWEIADVVSGIVFSLIPEGGKIEFEGVSGSSVTNAIKKYGAALAVTWETIEGRKLYKFVDQMEATRSALYNLWANIHYGLLATAGATNQITWQTGSTVLEQDIATLNLGAETIGDVNKDKGYGDTANARFVLFISPKLRTRINRALRATSLEVISGQNTNGQTMDANIDVYYTFNSNIPVNKGLLALPGHKIQNSIYMRELGLSKKEIESLNELRTYWTAFGAVVGDADQVYELAFA